MRNHEQDCWRKHFWVKPYEEYSNADIANFGEFVECIEKMKMILTKSFDEKIANMVIKNILGNTKINITEG